MFVDPFDLPHGLGLDLSTDHRLRDTLLALGRGGPHTRESLAAALAARFPARWPRQDEDRAATFAAMIDRAVAGGLARRDADDVVTLAASAAAALDGLDIVTSSCGASMVRVWPEGRPAPTIYCHHCGCLM